MTFAPGDWLQRPDGSVVRVISVESGTLLAELPDGSPLDWPLGNAEARWRAVPSSGLAVRMVHDPEGIQRLLKEDPAALLVAVLEDLGGRGTTKEVKERVGRVLSGPEYSRWWKRVQATLEDDPRIDTSEALKRTYRLLSPGERQSTRRRSRRSVEVRAGRVLLDGPTLSTSRERAFKSPVSDQETRDDLLSEAALAHDPLVDPTDRFLAGEIAVAIGAWPEARLAMVLGDDARLIDLLRVRHHESRPRALRLGSDRLVSPYGGRDARPEPVLMSAVALGDENAATAIHTAKSLGLDGTILVSAAVAWAMPGSTEAGDLKYPADVDTYRRRVQRFQAWVASGELSLVRGLLRGALRALDQLDATFKHGSEWHIAMGSLASLVWTVAERDRRIVASELKTYPPERGGSWEALIQKCPDELLPFVRGHVEDAFVRSPKVRAALKAWSERAGVGFGDTLHDIAYRLVRGTRAASIAVDAATTRPEDPTRAAESDTLAGTLNPDHPDVIQSLQRIANQASRQLIESDASREGPLLLTQDGWRGIVRSTHEVVTGAVAERDAALSEQRRLANEAESLRAALERRREALVEVQSDRRDGQGADVFRVASNLFRPVAAALGDSHESGSLPALQDQLTAALSRLGIEAIAEPGTTVTFDPDYHKWVGDGYPPTTAMVLTPGYVARREGADEVVLAPARVTNTTD